MRNGTGVQHHDAAQESWQHKEKQVATLRSLSESLNIARETAHTVSIQSEQLGRTERAVEESQHAVDMSKRIMRGMTWSGWIYNKLSAPPQPNGDPNDQIAMGFICPDCKVVFKTPDELATHYTKTHENTRPNHQNGKSPGSASSAPSSNGTTQQMPRTKLEAQEEFLQALEPQLSELKEVSLALGSALEAQNHHLDRIDTKIDRVKDDMTQVSAQARRVAAGKMHVNYRFRCAIQCINTGKFLQDVNGEPMLSADVVLDGCSFRAYTLGDGTDTWGFQSEKTSLFLGVNRFGYLKVKGSDFHSYEQFALDVGKAKTALFCYASFFGLGGWVTQLGNGKLNVIRGTPENKASAAFFKVVNLDAIADALKSER